MSEFKRGDRVFIHRVNRPGVVESTYEDGATVGVIIDGRPRPLTFPARVVSKWFSLPLPGGGFICSNDPVRVGHVVGTSHSVVHEDVEYTSGSVMYLYV